MRIGRLPPKEREERMALMINFWRVAMLATLPVLFVNTAMADTVVTTYVTKTQDERQSTRFNLTEWLRIKERMKMMDVWLSMFSDPKKDKFAPELNLM